MALLKTCLVLKLSLLKSLTLQSDYLCSKIVSEFSSFNEQSGCFFLHSASLPSARTLRADAAGVTQQAEGQ